ncbi:hypothetical protein ACFOD0_02465 [Shewanella intestini]|uniref:Uncharacterized protein n=1 Tax=Shewanella intestini TaxID=2017544 RepID=A0ABS5I179_9GAMM|nr:MULTISPECIES: hypothetical protein [Shewanella]MBR9727779.1 hypothetical protein [Shewanella intestini]MRG36228.1 hypothetical protein [Shewanella sp. XMDDZSB0408]
MNRHTHTLPKLFELHNHCKLVISIAPQLDDLAMLAQIGNPFLELIVNDISCGQAKLLIKQAPIVDVELVSHEANRASMLKQNGDDSDNIITRTLGQGFRLYAKLGSDPRNQISALKQGITLSIVVNETLELSNNSDAKFQWIALEHDFRQQKDIDVLTKAHAIIARGFAAEQTSNALALQITELEQVRREINTLLKQQQGCAYQNLYEEMDKLDHLLHNKRQWLFRVYQQSLERNNLQHSANQHPVDIEALQHKLDCYALLSPKSVVDMVENLSEEFN